MLKSILQGIAPSTVADQSLKPVKAEERWENDGDTNVVGRKYNNVDNNRSVLENH